MFAGKADSGSQAQGVQLYVEHWGSGSNAVQRAKKPPTHLKNKAAKEIAARDENWEKLQELLKKESE